MRSAVLLIGLITTNVVWAQVTGFDGFDWGSSRNDIWEVRGEPDKFEDTEITYSASDEVGGFAVDKTTFHFKQGCSALKETVSQDCFLWSGRYEFATRSRDDVETIIKLLETPYGPTDV